MDRKTRPFRIHRIPASVFLQQDHCRFKKRNTACTAVSNLRSFSTCPANPQCSFVIPKQVRRTKGAYPLIGKSSERTEDEHILHPLQTSGRHIRFHHSSQFIPAQERRRSLLFHAQPSQFFQAPAILHPPLLLGHLENFTETLQIFSRRISGQPAGFLQIPFKCRDELPV